MLFGNRVLCTLFNFVPEADNGPRVRMLFRKFWRANVGSEFPIPFSLFAAGNGQWGTLDELALMS